MKLISFISPCYNEEDVIDEYYKRVCAVASKYIDYEFEFLIVNDGSTDNSKEIINDIAKQDSRVKAIHFAANRGHQTALFAGIEHSSGDLNITIDIDLQDPPELVGEFIKMERLGYDVIHAKRRSREGESFFKIFSAKLFYKLIGLLAGIKIIDECGDFRAFTGKVRETIVRFKEKHKFLRGLFVLVGYNQCVVMYDRDRRFSGETKYSLRKMLTLALDAIISFSVVPINMIFVASMMMWGISLIYLLYSLSIYTVYGSTISGWMSIIFLQVFLTGIVLFFMGIKALYLGRVYEQGQRRPDYWIESKTNFGD